MSRHPKGGFDAFMQWSQSKQQKDPAAGVIDPQVNVVQHQNPAVYPKQFTSPATVHPMQVQQPMQQQPVYNMQPPARQFAQHMPMHHMQPPRPQQPSQQQAHQFSPPARAPPNAATYVLTRTPPASDASSNYQPASPSRIINEESRPQPRPASGPPDSFGAAGPGKPGAKVLPSGGSPAQEMTQKQSSSRPPSTAARTSTSDSAKAWMAASKARDPSLAAQEAEMSRFLSVNDVIRIADDLSQLVADTAALMVTVADKDKEAEAAAEADELQRREEAKQKREEEKAHMRNLLVRLEHEKMPLWRHKVHGHDLKLLPPEKILKGKDLFRCIAFAVLKLYVKPLMLVRQRHLAARSAERDDLHRTLRMYMDPCASWLAKVVKIPIISMQKDTELDFSVKWDVFESKYLFDRRMMQLKVRIKAVVKSLVSSPMPNERITKFLVTLTDSGNYFVDDFLFPMEKERLEFDTLGATMNMIAPLPDDDPRAQKMRSLAAATAADGEELDPDLDPVLLHRQQQELVEEDIELDRCQRVRMLLQNFILVRILIGRVLLSPWHCGICTKPNPTRSPAVLANQRMLASVLYEMLREMDHDLPAVVVVPFCDDEAAAVSKGRGAAEPAAPDVNAAKPAAPSGGAEVDLELGNAGGASETAGQNVQPKHLVPNLGSEREGDIFGFGKLASEKQSKAYHQLKEVDKDLGALQRLGLFLYNTQAQVGNLSIFVYNSLIERANELTVHTNRTEVALLAERQGYETMEETHRYLFPSDGSDINDLRRIHKPYIQTWAAELNGELADWLDKLTLHVIAMRQALRRGEHGDHDGDTVHVLDND